MPVLPQQSGFRSQLFPSRTLGAAHLTLRSVKLYGIQGPAIAKHDAGVHYYLNSEQYRGSPRRVLSSYRGGEHMTIGSGDRTSTPNWSPPAYSTNSDGF